MLELAALEAVAIGKNVSDVEDKNAGTDGDEVSHQK